MEDDEESKKLVPDQWGKGKEERAPVNVYMYKAYSFACQPMLRILHLRAQATTPLFV
jgi:hypothetical protein